MNKNEQNQVTVLSNLRPETILGIEGVSFTSRARSLPGVVTASEALGDIGYIANRENEEIDVRNIISMDPDIEERMVVMDKFIVAGGLCYDQDSEYSNPMEEGAANGKIFHRGRRGRGNEEASFYEASGLSADGVKELNTEAVSNELVLHITATIRKNVLVMTYLSDQLRRNGSEMILRRIGKSAGWDRVLKCIAEAVHQEGWEYAMDYVAEYFFNLRYWSEVTDEWQKRLAPLASLLTESEAESAWERAFEAGALGNSLSVLLDIYEHSGISYSIAGSGMQCRWDTSSAGAIWVPDDDAKENILYNVLRTIGIGEVKWFGACGSKEDPINARYSLDVGATWIGEGSSWNWNQAMAAMMDASCRKFDPRELGRLMAAEAKNYCKGVLEEYNSWVNGEVYGVVVYVIDRETGDLINSDDDECWGFVGRDHAEQSLEETLLNTVLQLGSPVH